MKGKLGPTVGIILALLVGTAFGIMLQDRCDVSSQLDALRMKRCSVLPPVPTVNTEDGIPEELQGKLSLFILAGQSNIAGRGEVPESEQHTNPRVFVFGNDYH